MALTNEDLKVMKELIETSIETSLDPIKRDIRNIELTLENEINPNIRMIAEGHLDLNRKLDEALKIENEKEMLFIRVNHLENEFRKMKERPEDIA